MMVKAFKAYPNIIYVIHYFRAISGEFSKTILCYDKA